MENLPFHPLYAHVTLGLVFLLPLLTTGILWGVRKKYFSPSTWIIVLFLLCLLLGAGGLSMTSGEEEVLKNVLPLETIEFHKDKAYLFVFMCFVLFVLGIVGAFYKEGQKKFRIQVAIVLGSFLIMAWAVTVGHSGGELVYKYGAAEYYTSKQKIKSGGLNP